MLIGLKQKLNVWLALMVFGCLLTFTSGAYALNIWTTDSACAPQQLNEFSVGENVYIRVENLTPNTNYDWTIVGNPGSCDAGVTVDSGTFDTDGAGFACFNSGYMVAADDCGVYKVFAGPYTKTYKAVGGTTLPAITITKTVGTQAGACASGSAITVAPGTTVYYCITVTNNGDTTLNYHDLVDDELGTIFTGLNYALTPGSSVSTVTLGLSIPAVINTTTPNTATWTAYNAEGADEAVAQDSATVTVRSTTIPTLSEWGMILMSLVLAGSAVWMIRRRRMA